MPRTAKQQCFALEDETGVPLGSVHRWACDAYPGEQDRYADWHWLLGKMRMVLGVYQRQGEHWFAYKMRIYRLPPAQFDAHVNRPTLPSTCDLRKRGRGWHAPGTHRFEIAAATSCTEEP